MNIIGVSHISAFLAAILCAGCSGPDSQDMTGILPVPFSSVRVDDNFWAPKIEVNKLVTIPIAIEQSVSTGRIRNFEVAGGLTEGSFNSLYPFDDSDVYKIIEGASYSLQTFPDPVLESLLDTLIMKIGRAQEEDGYLYTYRTIMGDNSHPWIGSKRWEKTHLLSHELYNLGHLYEAAVAHFQATGKSELLDIALLSADLVDRDFGWGRLETYPGHQEIEIGLVKLYRLTGDERYLKLARFFLDVRGPGGEEYSQSHLKVVDQTESVGHAVRACYMYTGMADVAALTGDESYLGAIGTIWEDVVARKMYITGGIGSTGDNEGFGPPYNLPNATAYCETCASIASVFWNQRMFLHHGEAKYYDMLERTLYNALLSGVSLTGDRFFYSNVLESSGANYRKEWFGCACCPSNISRFIPSIPGYIYAFSDNGIYINLFMSNSASIEMEGNQIEVIQETNYPWDGTVAVTVNPEREERFSMLIRLPGWALNQAIPGNLYSFEGGVTGKVKLLVNGKESAITMVNGYAKIDRRWRSGDRIELSLPMEIRKVVADERVKADSGMFAIQRGPLVYCAEWPGETTGPGNLLFSRDAPYTARFSEDELNGTEIITTFATRAGNECSNEPAGGNIQEVTMIPYHLWNNRGAGKMIVWLPG